MALEQASRDRRTLMAQDLLPVPDASEVHGMADLLDRSPSWRVQVERAVPDLSVE
jgi:hypothetical protein